MDSSIRQVECLKTQFLATVSHELRTPLTSIIGFTSLMLERSLGPISRDQSEALGRVMANSNRLLALINSMIDLSSLHAGTMEAARERFDASRLLREAAEAVEPEARGKALALSVRASELLIVETDRAKLGEIILNIAHNAVKFTERGEVTLEAAREGDFVRLAVRDTGPGLSSEEQEVIFEDFYQLDGASARRHNGMGMGLAISRKLADFLGAALEVDSRPGRGSVFTVSLPAARPL